MKLQNMQEFTRNKLNEIFKGSRLNLALAAVTAVAIISVGYVLVRTNASGYFASNEVEQSTLSGNAQVVNDSTASGGSAIKFNSPAPTPTPTPPPPTPTPPPSSSTTCPLPAYPSASCTGVPAGTALTVVNGNMTISTDNTIVDSKDIRGCVTITATGVIIRKSKITCSGSAVMSEDRGFAGMRVLIEDSEISCNVTNGTAIAEANITVRRSNIHGCENGFDVNQYITLEDSYIHDMAEVGADPHTDGLQMASGHYVGGNIVAGALNVTIQHNYIILHGTSAVISNRNGSDTNILIQDNLMAGGAYTLYCEQDGTHGVNYRVINNHFSRIMYNTVGAYGPWTDCDNETQVTGNVYHETGLPVPF